MSIPFLDIHTHHGAVAEDILSVRSYFLQEVDSMRNFPFTAGIHPWHADNFTPIDAMRMLEDLFLQSNCIAIGETGLDKKSKADFNKQKELFEIHFDFAQKIHYPLIIHNVGAWNEMMDYTKVSEVPFIYHGYQANREVTRQLLRYNCYFSFGKSLFRNSSLQEIIKEIPVEHLFFETDEANFSIHEIYVFAAELLKLSKEELKEKIFSNFNRVFKIEAPF